MMSVAIELKPIPRRQPIPRRIWLVCFCLCGLWGGEAHAQPVKYGELQAVPRVVVPASGQQLHRGRSAKRILYPWKTFVVCSIFWIGEKPTEANPVPNFRSSWDMHWERNFGGYDDPNPKRRIADHVRGEFRPKAFIPKLNPFYVALPYNDLAAGGGYKPEANRVIPWFHRDRINGRVHSVCKGRWVQIFKDGRSCYAQWEDCGPWETNDWPFVFGSRPPKNKHNKAAGIDLSPAIRDYLKLKSSDKTHWRFVEESQVPYGPWKKYGQQRRDEEASSLLAQREYLEYLRKLRDQQFLKKSLRELQY